MQIHENIPLAPYTTLQVGGAARYFAEPADEDEIPEALRWARARSVPVFGLGGGSNLLVSDAGFDGLVLHAGLHGIEAEEDADKMIYRVAAGGGWGAIVEKNVAGNWGGRVWPGWGCTVPWAASSLAMSLRAEAPVAHIRPAVGRMWGIAASTPSARE